MASDTLCGRAVCWRIDRRDGVSIGLTAHDRDLEIDGLIHRAGPGMLPSAIALGEADARETMEVTGPLTVDAIGERDLIAGRWDGAAISIAMVDWSEQPVRTTPIGTGTLGSVAIGDEGFSAQLKGPIGLLDGAGCETTAPDCRAELGDRRCRVPMAGRRHLARVAAIDGDAVTIDVGEPVANGFGGGRLRWLSGPNGGLDSAVLVSAADRLTLREPPAFAPVAGDLIEAVEGCDKLFATCRARFGNAANFRGEPFLPGIDLLTRYPGAGA